MKRDPFASETLLRLAACPEPSRCPYCPAEALRHWTHWGSYERYADDPEDPFRRVAVARYWCKVQERTFSLLPDALLPYCGVRIGLVLQGLYTLFVNGIALNALARHVGRARATLQCLRARFLRALPKLRLPQHEAALRPADFLAVLAGMEPEAVARIFRDWKEREPKLSVLGVYVR